MEALSEDYILEGATYLLRRDRRCWQGVVCTGLETALGQ